MMPIFGSHCLMLAWRPFLDPMNVTNWWWWTIIPIALLISMVYKAVRLPHMKRYWLHVVRMTVQIIAGFAAIAIILFIAVQWLVPAMT